MEKESGGSEVVMEWSFENAARSVGRQRSKTGEGEETKGPSINDVRALIGEGAKKQHRKGGCMDYWILYSK